MMKPKNILLHLGLNGNDKRKLHILYIFYQFGSFLRLKTPYFLSISYINSFNTQYKLGNQDWGPKFWLNFSLKYNIIVYFIQYRFLQADFCF